MSTALDHAFKILSWYENCTKEEMPPKWMWTLDWELDDWWFEIDLLRQGKFKDGADNRERVEMMSNEYSPMDND